MYELLSKPAEIVAPRLLGWEIVRTINGVDVGGMIVETEAYDQSDAASHSYKGKTPRSKVMFGAPGYAYVYFTYGMHYCMNVVTGKEGEGSAVLIRAIQPLYALDVMRMMRNQSDPYILTNGPAKLCQAMCIDTKLNGHNLLDLPLRIKPPVKQIPLKNIIAAQRIGISQDTHRLWRFYIQNNQFVSR